MLLMIDNYDSFTYNLVLYFQELGATVKVVKNDAISLSDIHRLAPSHIVISPGPCTPNEAGISIPAIHTFAGKIPLLGVCLGHQSIAQAFGGRVVRAQAPIHGKVSAIYHQQQGVFAGLPSPFNATRYHSLIAEAASLPDCLEATAWTHTEQGKPHEIMAIKHRHWPLEGVQFHPESVLSQHGHALLRNFLQQ